MAPVDVYQCKYFINGVDDPQKAQIRESFKTASNSPDFTVNAWYLCLPVNLSVSEARWFVVASAAVFLILILLSYTKADPGWSHSNVVAKLGNLGGRVGAWTADLLLFIFGLSVWWWCVMLLRLVWNGYRQQVLTL